MDRPERQDTYAVAPLAIWWSLVAVVAGIASAVLTLVLITRPMWAAVVPRASQFVLALVSVGLWLGAQWWMWQRLQFYRRDVEDLLPGLLNERSLAGRDWMRLDRLAELGRLTRLSQVTDVEALAEQGPNVRWLVWMAVLALATYPVAYLTLGIIVGLSR